jgi:hypothetical protein
MFWDLEILSDSIEVLFTEVVQKFTNQKTFNLSLFTGPGIKELFWDNRSCITCEQAVIVYNNNGLVYS